MPKWMKWFVGLAALPCVVVFWGLTDAADQSKRDAQREQSATFECLFQLSQTVDNPTDEQIRACDPDL